MHITIGVMQFACQSFCMLHRQFYRENKHFVLLYKSWLPVLDLENDKNEIKNTS